MKKLVILLALSSFMLVGFIQTAARTQPQTTVSRNCNFSLIDTPPPADIIPITLAEPQIVYTAPGAIQLGAWGSADEGVLLTRDLPRGNRQAVELFDPQTGRVTPLGTRARSNFAPTLENGILNLRDWSGQRGITLPTQQPACPEAFAPAQVLQFQSSPDGRYLAAIVSSPAVARGNGAPVASSQLVLLDFVAGSKRVLQPFSQYVTDIAWGADGWLAVLGAGAPQPGAPEVAELMWVTAPSGVAYPSGISIPLGGGVWGTQLRWSPDGGMLLAACPTVDEGRLCQFNNLRIAADSVARPLALSNPVRPLAQVPAPDSQLLDLSARHVFTMPQTITLDMYLLTASGAPRSPYTLCEEGDTAFGCTAFCSESGYGCPLNDIFPYPYATSTITISLETDYLPDVVPRELGVFYAPAALEAQAVAARSYALWHIVNNYAYNNSIWYQAFIPLTFEWVSGNYPFDADHQWDDPCGADYASLTAAQQQVCAALAAPDYVSYNTADNFPARTQFSADAYASTDNGSRPYEIGVSDPISTACDANNFGHRTGMSQEGASRWARGDECSWSGAGVVTGNDPGGAWSVTWNRDQILVHYYAGVHLLDTDSNRTTPAYRWNPLSVANPLGWVFQSGGYLFDVGIQNTGVSDWLTGTIGVQQVWVGAAGAYTTVVATDLSLPVAADGWLSIYLPPSVQPAPGVYTVTVDLALWDAVTNQWEPFATREPSLPWYALDVVVEVRAVASQIWLPLVVRE